MDKTLSEMQGELPVAAPSSATVERTPTYFGAETDALFGWLHRPKLVAQRQTGLLICPPIGHEYVHSHRPLRHLADHLAAAGFATLRFDYHGSGDSGGLNQDPGRVSAWLDSIRQAITALKTQSGCTDIGLLGVRMGATFASIIAAEQDVQQLVVWEPCVQGRRFVRELKALHMTASAAPAASAAANQDIESAGFVITRETAEDLGKLNLKDITPRTTHVFIGERDDAVDDYSLRDAWLEKGLHPEYRRLSGYADMMAETHFTIVPTDAIQQIVAWCCAHCEAPRPARLSGASASEPRSQTRITARQYLAGDTAGADAQTVAEYLLRFGEQQTLFGIVSQPQVSDWRQHPTIILLNSGSVHHIGPHRLYVFLARHFAQLGFRCLRMDFAGLGDSVIDDVAHENHPYTKTATRDTAQAIAALKREQPQTDFMLMGLCSGAYAAFHASIAIPNERIIESVLINPLTFYWKEGMSLAIPSEAHYRQWNDYMVSMRKWDKWLKLLRGGVSIAEIISTLRERFQILVSVKYKELKKKFAPTATVGSPQRDLSEDLHTIVKQGRQISFVFSENDPGYGLLITNAKGMVNKLKRQHKLDIQFISKADHTFSKSAARAVVMEKLTGILTGRYLN